MNGSEYPTETERAVAKQGFWSPGRVVIVTDTNRNHGLEKIHIFLHFLLFGSVTYF